MENKNKEIIWRPHGPVCKQCGAMNPTRHNICPNCGGETNEFEDSEMTKEQYEVFKEIKDKLK